MSNLSEKFQEQFIRVQQQFNQWKPFEQLYATIELTRLLQLSYRHYLAQSLQNEIHCENNEMFNHTVDEANTPNFVACRRSAPLEKILTTIQLYLPLISCKPISKELLNAYREILSHLDSQLTIPHSSSYSEQQLSSFSQIAFFLQINPNLKGLLADLPHLIQILQSKTTPPVDQGQYQHQHKPLQRYSSIRSDQSMPAAPLMTCSSEGSRVSPIRQQMMCYEGNDSGVDLTEAGINNSLHNFLSSHHHQQLQPHPFAGRAPAATGPSPVVSPYRSNNNHSLVTETVSSPIPEQVLSHVPLAAALSAPVSSPYSDYRQRQALHRTGKMNPTLPKSDEEEEETAGRDSNSPTDNASKDQSNANQPTKMLRPWTSLRQRSTRPNLPTEDVSQYLDVDGNSRPIWNTFIQPNTGMRDVPKWLKHLRLHKYDPFFCRMTYDQMMNLTKEQLKELNITDGACAKILLNIQKLKERPTHLKQAIDEFEKGQIDLATLVQHLNELMLTPIRAKPRDQEIPPDEDLPKLIIDILETAYQRLAPSVSPELGNKLLGLFDCCYRHEAFTVEQRHLILQWRGRLSNSLQKLGKIEFKAIHSVSSHPLQPRRSMKTPVRNIKSNSVLYHGNTPTNSIPLTQYISEPQNKYSVMDSNPIRRPVRSPTSNFPAGSEADENNKNNSRFAPAFTAMGPSSQRGTGAYLAEHQHRETLARKPSMYPYVESNPNRAKLCKTLSEPNQIRFHKPSQMTSSPLSSINTQPNAYRMMLSTPYSQQPFLNSSPIGKPYVSNNQSDYYDDSHHSPPASVQDQENLDEQRQSNTDFDSFYRQITESAMSEDAVEVSLDTPKDTTADSKPNLVSPNSTVTQQ